MKTRGRVKPHPIKVLSYNIHKGFSTSNRRFVLRQIKQGIRTVHADLVLLQEVVGAHERHGRRIREWPIESQFEYLAEELWPHFAYGRNAVYRAGHHGNAILSRFPIVSWENVNLSANALEQRGLLHAVIAIPHYRQPVHVLCIHMGLLESWRRQQVETLCRRIEASVPHDAPLVIAGDFNDWRERITRALAKRLDLVETFMEMHGAHARTYPSKLPAFKLDRVYIRHLEAVRADRLDGLPWTKLSDHTPLLVELVV